MKARSPSAERNRQPILSVLKDELPSGGIVLEIASGTGTHVTFFALNLPQLQWQPSDIDKDAITSIQSWREDSELENLLPPIHLDVTNDSWPIATADAILAINMLHIAPWSACSGLFKGAARLLSKDRPVMIYGPFVMPNQALEPSNVEFDRYLRRLSSEYGIRSLTDITAVARKEGFELSKVVSMPANNRTLVFRRSPTA